jgi:selenocysteine lyase/cysteine desulfurase
LTSPTAQVERFRSQMPVAGRWAYFDHAAVAPLPQTTGEAVSRWLGQAMRDGDTCWAEWAQEVEHTRQRAAELINAQPKEIALVPNTTLG